MQESTEPRDKTPVEGRTEITPIIAHPLALAIFLSLIFSLAGLFLMVIVPQELNSFLEKNYISDPLSVDEEYIEVQAQYESVLAFLSPLAYLSFWLLIVIIILGVIIKRYKLSFLGSLTFYLPIFGQFAGIMGSFFAGIGVIRTLWLPFLDYTPELLNLGVIFYIPVLVMFFLIVVPLFYIMLILNESLLIPLLGEVISVSIMNILIYMIIFFIAGVGFFILTFATATWLYGRFQGKKIIDFWIYRYSRHPQYLGLIIWNYGLLMLSIPPFALFPPTFPFLILTLVIVGMALNEENTMIRQHTEEYITWRERTPFLVPLLQRISSLITYPMRKVIKKEWPENNKDIIVVLLIYGGIVVLLSLPLLNIPLFGR
ncbi:MAG: methyltransferase family protein [Promethearchaeota archaeon]